MSNEIIVDLRSENIVFVYHDTGNMTFIFKWKHAVNMKVILKLNGSHRPLFLVLPKVTLLAGKSQREFGEWVERADEGLLKDGVGLEIGGLVIWWGDDVIMW